MKKITIILGIIILTLMSYVTFAQSPPHPNSGGAPGSGNIPVGGGAPIGGGLLIMFALGLGYAASKIYHFREQNKQLS